MWFNIIKGVSSKEYIDGIIQDLREQFIQFIREDNPNVDEAIILQTANTELIAYVKDVVFEGKEIPIPKISGE